MAVRVTVRRASQRRYGELLSALDLVAQALDTVHALIDGADDTRAHRARWQPATAEDLRAVWGQTDIALGEVRSWVRLRERDLLKHEWSRR